MPMRRGDEVTTEVLQRPGRFQTVSENLRVKEVMMGEGERRRRYVVCHNPQEEKRQRAHRRQVLYELEAELASLKEVRGTQFRITRLWDVNKRPVSTPAEGIPVTISPK
jgi:hypothetical protein